MVANTTVVVLFSPQGGNHCKACFIDAARPKLGGTGLHALMVCFGTAIGVKGSVGKRYGTVKSMMQDANRWDKICQLTPIAFLQTLAGRNVPISIRHTCYWKN